MHCGKALYNNLLWKNWNTQCLPLMIIIGNSFNGMRDRFVQHMNNVDASQEIGLDNVLCFMFHQNDRQRVPTWLQLHYSGSVCVRGEGAALPTPIDRCIQWHGSHHLSSQQPKRTPTIHLGRATRTSVWTLPWSGDYSEGNAKMRQIMDKKGTGQNRILLVLWIFSCNIPFLPLTT